MKEKKRITEISAIYAIYACSDSNYSAQNRRRESSLESQNRLESSPDNRTQTRTRHESSPNLVSSRTGTSNEPVPGQINREKTLETTRNGCSPVHLSELVRKSSLRETDIIGGVPEGLTETKTSNGGDAGTKEKNGAREENIKRAAGQRYNTGLLLDLQTFHVRKYITPLEVVTFPSNFYGACLSYIMYCLKQSSIYQ